MDRLKNIKIIKEHYLGVRCLLLLNDGRLASSSVDGTINIYNLTKEYHCELCLKGHSSNVSYIFQTDNGKLISCSSDKSIKIWNISETSYKCDYTFLIAHNEPINKVIPLLNNRIGSCSDDNTIKLWNCVPPYNQLATLEGHTDFVNSIIELKEKNSIISGSNDNTLRVWSLSSYKCDTIIQKIECYFTNSMIILSGNRVVIGGINTITIIKIVNYEIELIISNSKLHYIYSLTLLKNGNILCGCEYGMICIFNPKKKNLQFINERIHQDSVQSLLEINKNTFISCSLDKTIKVWEY